MNIELGCLRLYSSGREEATVYIITIPENLSAMTMGT